MFDFNVISYLLITISLIFINHKVGNEIKDTCSYCKNNVSKPMRKGLYKLRYFLWILSHICIALTVYYLLK